MKIFMIFIYSILITNLIAVEINTVNFARYPLSKTLTSQSHGGDLPDKIAATDGIGNLVLKKLGKDNSNLNNFAYNKFLKDNLNKLDNNNSLNDLITSGIITVDTNIINKINNNKFVLLHINGTDCDDNNSQSFGEKWLNDICQGGIVYTLNHCYGLPTGFTINGQLVVDRNLLDDMISNGDDITNVCTSNITDMSSLFQKDYNSFNQPIGNWDVSHVTDMSYMFSSVMNDHLTNFNQDISNWDVSNVTDMNNMFNSTKFDQDISNWNILNVTNMSNMFMYSHFNHNISNWNVSGVLLYNQFSYNGWLSAANSPF